MMMDHRDEFPESIGEVMAYPRSLQVNLAWAEGKCRVWTSQYPVRPKSCAGSHFPCFSLSLTFVCEIIDVTEFKTRQVRYRAMRRGKFYEELTIGVYGGGGT